MSVLSDFISVFSGKRVFYYPNPGNAGDSFITVATIDFLRRCGVDLVVCDHYFEAKINSVLLYGGGGSFWTRSRVPLDFLRVQSPSELGNTIVVLPQTFWDNQEFFKCLGHNVHLFCREKLSYEYMAGLGLGANVYLDQDMAFYLDIRAWMARHSIYSLFFSSPSRTFKAMRRWAAAKSKAGGGKSLLVIRTDKEKAGHSWGDAAHSVDLSRAFSMGTRRESYANVSAWFFLKFIDRYVDVTTDRLHVAIAAAMLGKQVNMYGNAYFKSKAVFEHSMAGRFKSVSFYS